MAHRLTPNPRALRNEAPWLPKSIAEAAAVRAAIMDAGYSFQVASGLVGWLIAKAAGEPDRTSNETRTRYRVILAELELPPLLARTPRMFVTGAGTSRAA